MSDIAQLCLKAGLIGLAFIAAVIWAFFRGRDTAEKKSIEKQAEADLDANKIQNRIDTDDAYRQRVRDKFKDGN